MSPLLAAAVLALAAERPVVQSVVLEPYAVPPTLTISASAPLPPPAASRDGDLLTLTWDADLSPGVSLPPPSTPIKALRLSPRDGRLALEVRIDPAVPFAVETAEGRVRVTFGAPPVTPPDAQALWLTLFPATMEPEPLEAEPAETTGQAPSERADEDGLLLGPFLLRPTLEAVFVTAESTFVSPQPVRDDYFEIRPRVAAQASLGAGSLTGDYEARWRRASRFAEVQRASHVVNAGFELPVGPSLTLRVSDHYARGTLETREVDPGGEYFFGLGRFTRNRFALQARLQTASRLRGEARASWEDLEIDDRAAFFDYKRRTIEARLGYELGPRLTAALALASERIPPPFERPLVETSARSLAFELQGDLGPLTTGELALGLRDQDTPGAADGGREFRGLVLGARVRRELGPEATLQISGTRGTFPSAFEGNAFYLASVALAELDIPVPAALVLRVAAGYHWNDYRTPAIALSEPRRDRIWEGAIGLARPLTRRAWVRADYRRERRNSNLDAFDVRTQALTVQVGFGFLGSPGR